MIGRVSDQLIPDIGLVRQRSVQRINQDYGQRAGWRVVFRAVAVNARGKLWQLGLARLFQREKRHLLFVTRLFDGEILGLKVGDWLAAVVRRYHVRQHHASLHPDGWRGVLRRFRLLRQRNDRREGGDQTQNE